MQTILLFSFTPHASIQLFCLLFLGILFTQSGMDKVLNYKGNLDYFKSHFAKSPLKNMVGLMMPVITLLETAAGILSLAGVVLLVLNDDTSIGLIGAQLSALSVLALFFGQRLAQDYAGAAVLVGYFLICIASIYFLS
ncbi:MAG: DoxX family protein [Bacteroidota bacterium]